MMFLFRKTAVVLALSMGLGLGSAAAAQPFDSVYQTTPQGLKYRVIQAGHGAKPQPNDEVEIRFTSYRANGEELEGTRNGVPVILPISEMFAGLQQSLLMMPVGSTYEFDIPAHLGFSEEGRAGRQAVRYRIELLRINP